MKIVAECSTFFSSPTMGENPTNERFSKTFFWFFGNLLLLPSFHHQNMQHLIFIFDIPRKTFLAKKMVKVTSPAIGHQPKQF